MNRKKKRIVPRLPSGFRDLHPDECAGRDWMIERVCDIYRTFGFVALDTSPVEYLHVLLSGHQESGDKQIYRLFKDTIPEPEKSLALRFELTASLARYLAQNIDRLPMPFKRYQSGYVWRGERPQRGRFRQFLQFDVDIIGVEQSTADTEIIEVIYRSMEALGVPDFAIKLSSRNLLSHLALKLGISNTEERSAFFRVLDKHDKIGTSKLLRLCAESPSRGGLGFGTAQVGLLDEFVSLRGSNEEILESVLHILDLTDAVKAMKELQEILELWSSARVNHPEYLKVVPHMARGLDYYTGPIFETVITHNETIGSVMSGGRYDGLIGSFLDRSIPAVGVSMGIDRLFVALKDLDILNASASSCRVLVTVLSNEETPLMFDLASRLRNEGISAELYLGSKYTFREQIKYAASRGIPFLLIQGENERKREVVSLRDLETREQYECSFGEAVSRLKHAK